MPNARIDALLRQTNYSYDELGRLRTKTYPDASTVQFSYDGENRLTKVVDATGTTQWQYKPTGWTWKEIKGTWQAEYAYLPNGLRQNLYETGPGGNRTLAYGYTGRNELWTITEGAQTTTFVYDDDSRLLEKPLANGAKTVYTYSQGRLESITQKDSANQVIASYTYSYQQNGRKKQVTEQDGSVVKWKYDFLNRLTRENRTGTSAYDLQWTYDNVGNRLSQTKNSFYYDTYTYDDDNRLLTVDHSSIGLRVGSQDLYTWNDNGNLIERLRGGVRHRFSYDYEDRLTGIDLWSGAWQQVNQYKYDGVGRRVWRWATSGGTPYDITFRFDGFLSVFREESSNLPPGLPGRYTYTWGHGLLASKDGVGGTTSWSATDQIGSMRKWTNDSGSAGSYSGIFDAFGQVVSQSGSRPPYGFGADWAYRDDGDAGLLHIGARWYDPVIGRWITADKYLGDIFDPLSLNRYLYVNNDPVNYVDPTGQVFWVLVVVVFVVVISAPGCENPGGPSNLPPLQRPFPPGRPGPPPPPSGTPAHPGDSDADGAPDWYDQYPYDPSRR